MSLLNTSLALYVAALALFWLSTNLAEQTVLQNHPAAAKLIKTISGVTIYFLLAAMMANALFHIKIVERIVEHADPIAAALQFALSAVVEALYACCLAGVVAVRCYDKIIVQFGYPPPLHRSLRSATVKSTSNTSHGTVVPFAKSGTPIVRSARVSPFLSPAYLGLAHFSIACLLFAPVWILNGGIYLLADPTRLFGQTQRVYQVGMTLVVYLSYFAHPIAVRLVELRWQYRTRVSFYLLSGIVVGILSLVCTYALIPRIIDAGAAAYAQLGLYYLNQHDDEKALTNLNVALTKDPRLSPAYNNRGNIFARRQQYDKALEDYDKAISISRYAGTLSNRCKIYRALAKPD